ncbi:MAG TPA: zinc-dependent dehydrogenase [Myxococcota bacterium]|nr:zinc-dependent dehydrogenase [Myxococcota bacterium]
MKVAVYHNNTDSRVEERPVPEIGPGEILVRVAASGICGSDVMEWYRIKKAPLVLGHEIAGTIEKVGPGVSRYKVRERVFVSHHVPCNTCRYCLSGQHTVCETLHTTNFDPGGFSEFVRVPAINVDRGLFILPDSMSFEEGTFIEPLACVLRGQRIAGVKPGKTVAVLGSGISGILHIALARALGVSQVIATDINTYRMKQAEKFGATAVLHGDDDVPAEIRKINQGRGADVVIVCAGTIPVLNQAILSVDRGGTVLFFATPPPGQDLPVPVNDFWRNGITLVPSYAGSPADCAEALDLIAGRTVSVAEMVTHRLPLSQIQEGFRLVAQGDESIKVIIEPGN